MFIKIALVYLFSTFLIQSFTKNLTFNFSEVEVAEAENAKGPTGLTLIAFPKGAYAAVDIRGGAAAVRESSSLEITNTWGYANAIVLAGGSTYGLESASGVMAAILKEKKYKTDFNNIPSVPAAVVYDFSKRTNAIYPDKELGTKAYQNKKTGTISIGAKGAGANVYVGKYLGKDFMERSGQGAAFFERDGLKILCISIVNAVGNIHNSSGEIIAGSFDQKNAKRLDIVEELNKKIIPSTERGNTTISVVVTNAKLDRAQLKRLAIMVHTSMAQTIRPFHTPFDGDTLFFASTGSHIVNESDAANIGVLASDTMQKAILSVFEQ